MEKYWLKLKLLLRSKGDKMTVSEFKEVIKDLMGYKNWSQETINFVTWLRKNKPELNLPGRLTNGDDRFIELTTPGPEVSSSKWQAITQVFMHAFKHAGNNNNDCLITTEEIKKLPMDFQEVIKIFDEWCPNESEFLPLDEGLLVKNYKSLKSALIINQQRVDAKAHEAKKLTESSSFIKKRELVTPNESDEIIQRLTEELNKLFDLVKNQKGELGNYEKFPEGKVTDFIYNFIQNSYIKGNLPFQFNENRTAFINDANVQVINETAFWELQFRINNLWRNHKTSRDGLSEKQKFERNKYFIKKLLEYFLIKVYEFSNSFKIEQMEWDNDHLKVEISIPAEEFHELEPQFKLKIIKDKRAYYQYNYYFSSDDEKKFFLV